MRLGVEDELIGPVAGDLKDTVLLRNQYLGGLNSGDARALTGAWMRYEYFMTSANRKLSCTLRKLPPFAAFTSEISEKPAPTLVVALMATKASQAQSWYMEFPGSR